MPDASPNLTLGTLAQGSAGFADEDVIILHHTVTVAEPLFKHMEYVPSYKSGTDLSHTEDDAEGGRLVIARFARSARPSKARQIYCCRDNVRQVEC